jgi:acyl carrier protein
MREIDQQAEREIRELVYDYFASECDVDRSRLTDETDIIEELEGDSLMLLSLLESVRRKYGLSVELKTLGRHLMNKPANTIGQIVELTLAIVRHGDDIVSLEL